MKRGFLIVLLPLVLLMACSETGDEAGEKDDGENGDAKDVVTAESDDVQQFKVVPAYAYVDTYLQAVEESPEDADELWQEKVIEPLREECFVPDGQHHHMIADYKYEPPAETDHERIENALDNLAARDVEASTIEALQKSSDKLPGPDTTACIFPGTFQDTSGVAVDAGNISIFYSDQDMIDLKGIVAHEYHHSAWTERQDDTIFWSLLENMVFEGRADYFKDLVYPDAYGPNISPDEEKELWDDITDSLKSRTERHQDVMTGGGKFPDAFGYIVGQHIVEAYIDKHPDTTIEDWTDMPATELFEESGYDGG